MVSGNLAKMHVSFGDEIQYRLSLSEDLDTVSYTHLTLPTILRV